MLYVSNALKCFLASQSINRELPNYFEKYKNIVQNYNSEKNNYAVQCNSQGSMGDFVRTAFFDRYSQKSFIR